MATYDIVFKPSVEKDLRSLPRSVVSRIFKRIKSLTHTPFPRQSLKLSGTEGLYRLRVGDYRVVYGVNSRTKCVVIHHVRHRKDVYRRL